MSRRTLTALCVALLLPLTAQALRVERLELRGQRALPTALLEAAAAPWLQRDLDEAQLEMLRQALTRVYVERGYTNSGVLIEADQPLPGTLRLRVVEGRLTQITLRGLDGLNPDYLRRRLGPAEGEALNLDRLRDQVQLLMVDPLIRRINARLLPAERAGEAELDVELERARPWQWSAYLNNHRPVSVGEWQAGVRGQWANLLGEGDTLDLHLGQALQQADQRQASLGAQLPLTRLALPFTRLQLSADHSDAAVREEPVRRLDIRSRVDGWALGLAHTLTESPTHKLQLGLQHQHRRQVSTLLGEPFAFEPNLPADEQGRLRTGVWRFWQEAQWRSEAQVWALRSSLAWGHSNVVPETVQAGVEPAPAPRFAYWTGQLQWVRKLSDAGVQATVRLNTQWARDRLLAQDGLSAGGVHSVRGHRENALVRDEGGVLNLELDWPLRVRESGTLTLQPFYDHARLRNRSQAWATLSSYGVAAHFEGQDWLLDWVLAKTLQRAQPAPSNARALQDHGMHLQLSRRW